MSSDDSPAAAAGASASPIRERRRWRDGWMIAVTAAAIVACYFLVPIRVEEFRVGARFIAVVAVLLLLGAAIVFQVRNHRGHNAFRLVILLAVVVATFSLIFYSVAITRRGSSAGCGPGSTRSTSL